VSAEIRSRLAPVRAAHPEVRWLADDQLHLTLAFIGALPPERLGPLIAALGDLASAGAPFVIRLGRAGRFGGRARPEVAWLGLADGRAACLELGGRVTAACRAAGVLEMPVEGRPDRPVLPHLTIARRATPGLPAAIDATLRARPLGWTAMELVLYRSHLGRPRVHYEALARLALGHDLPMNGAAG